MEYRVFFHPMVHNDIDRVPRRIEDEFWNIIENYLRHKPFAEGIGYSVSELKTKNLQGNIWSLHFHYDEHIRSFGFRAIYAVDGDRLVIYAVGPRPGFYKWGLTRVKRQLH